MWSAASAAIGGLALVLEPTLIDAALLERFPQLVAFLQLAAMLSAAGLLPEGTGLIVADGYDAEILRMSPESKLPGARRKVLMQKFAFHAARRLQGLRDPGAVLDGWG